MKKMMFSLLAISISACDINDSDDNKEPVVREGISTVDVKPVADLAYTYNSPSGNRLLDGKIDLLNASFVDINLSDTPEWLLSTNRDTSSIWVAVLEDGTVQGFELENGIVTNIEVSPSKIPADIFPILVIDNNGNVEIGNVIETKTAELSTTSVVDLASGKRAYIRNNGDLVLVDSSTEQSLAINAMPNTRMLVDENQRLLLLTDFDPDYTQHVLLNYSTAQGIALVETQPELKLVTEITTPATDVFEGNALMWADLDGDGQKEIITTISSPAVSSHIAVYDEQGNNIANSESIGISNRWRHQIAVADFGLGQQEVVATLFPHLDNEVEFFRLENGNLVRDFADLTLTSHRSSASQNVDMALAADVNADNTIDLLIPTEDFNFLSGVNHNSVDSVTTVWQTPVAIGGRLMTNISATANTNGELHIGVGNSNNQLRIWY